MSEYLDKWVEIGNRNYWISEADDPPFDSSCLHECHSIDELLDKFDHGNWCLGQGFYLGDLCFINQVDGGDEWLTTKQDVSFESISFRLIIQDINKNAQDDGFSDGRARARALIEDMQAATLEECRNLEY